MNDKTLGYVLLYKSMLENFLWEDKPYARGQAWIDLILLANFKDGEVFSKGVMIPIKRGQVFRSVDSLCDRWGWSPKKVRRFLNLLETQKMVHTEGLPQGTLITIEKYESFQCKGQASDPADSTSLDPASTHKRNKNNKYIYNTRSFEEEFDTLWKLYPRKSGKKDALRHYISARKKGVTYEAVLEGVNAYREKIEREGTDPKYIKMGSSWFNQHSWEDDYSFGRPVEEEIMSDETFERIIEKHRGADTW